VRLEGLSELKKEHSLHRVSNQRPSSLYHSASTTTLQRVLFTGQSNGKHRPCCTQFIATFSVSSSAIRSTNIRVSLDRALGLLGTKYHTGNSVPSEGLTRVKMKLPFFLVVMPRFSERPRRFEGINRLRLHGEIVSKGRNQ
jgi:hypothetical protein